MVEIQFDVSKIQWSLSLSLSLAEDQMFVISPALVDGTISACVRFWRGKLLTGVEKSTKKVRGIRDKGQHIHQHCGDFHWIVVYLAKSNMQFCSFRVWLYIFRIFVEPFDEGPRLKFKRKDDRGHARKKLNNLWHFGGAAVTSLILVPHIIL